MFRKPLARRRGSNSFISIAGGSYALEKPISSLVSILLGGMGLFHPKPLIRINSNILKYLQSSQPQKCPLRRILILLVLVAKEIDRLECRFTKLAGEPLERDAMVWQNLFDAIGSFFARDARHYLGPKRDIHFGSRPDAFGRIFVICRFHSLSRRPGIFCALSYGEMVGAFLRVDRRRTFCSAARSVF